MVRTIGGAAVTKPTYLRITVIAVVAGACLVSGCGRKGPLDLPPGRAALEQQPVAPTPDRDPALLQDQDEQGRAVAPTGPKRRTPLDWLID
jgi:predicted small lipoprotein YifL